MRWATNDEIAESLRSWAKGMYTYEAAAELLIRFNSGRLLGGSWVEWDEARDRFWFNAELSEDAGYLSSGEYSVLQLAAAIASETRTVSLGDAVAGLDRDSLDLVLAAIAHAGGSHEHSRPVFGHDGSYAGTRSLPTLHEWPTW